MLGAAAYASHLYLMNTYPRYYSQYDTLLIAQTSGLSAEELVRAKSIATTPVVQLLASR